MTKKDNKAVMTGWGALRFSRKMAILLAMCLSAYISGGMHVAAQTATPAAAPPPAPVAVQTEQNIEDLQQRLFILEEQIGNLLEAIEVLKQNHPPPMSIDADKPAAPPMPQQDAAALRLRLAEIEAMLNNLSGESAEMDHQLAAFKKNFTKFSEDAEFRFQELEKQEIAQADSAQIIGTVQRPIAVQSVQVYGEGAAFVGEAAASAMIENAADAPLFSETSDPHAMYTHAQGVLKQQKYSAAATYFKQFLELFPKHELAGHAQYWLGESYYVRKDYKRAAEAFLDGYTTYADSVKAPDSLLKLGMTLHALGDVKMGCTTLGEFATRFPDAAHALKQRAEIEKNRAGCL